MAIGNPQLHALYEYSGEDLRIEYADLAPAQKARVLYCCAVLSICERVWVVRREGRVSEKEWPCWTMWLQQLWQSKDFRWAVDWTKSNFDHEFMQAAYTQNPN